MRKLSLGRPPPLPASALSSSPTSADQQQQWVNRSLAEIERASQIEDPEHRDFADYTPVVTAGTGAFTTVSATGRWCQIGKLVFVTINVVITTNGTAGASVRVTLPTISNSDATMAGREYQLTGRELQGIIFATLQRVAVLNYDNTYPGGSGYEFDISGCYETQ